MKHWSAHQFRQAAISTGLPKDQTEAAWSFIRSLQDQGLAPVLTLQHLAHETASSGYRLRSVVTRDGIKCYYRSFRINKRSGGFRRIFIPTLELQSVLHWVHDSILTKLRPHPRAFAFRTGTSVVDCASEHCGARWLIKFDAKDFFESIDEVRVFRIFRDAGYPELLCFELARLTTVPIKYLISRQGADRSPSTLSIPNEGSYTIQDYDFPERGVLGQGLATSPVLSNLACRHLDEVIQSYATENDFVYTRYSDDITLSSAVKHLTRSRIAETRRNVLEALRKSGLRENQKKFSVVGPGGRRIVLGLLIDGDRPRLSRATRSRIEGHLKFLMCFGASGHAAFRGFRSIDALRQHVLGLLAYVKQVDPELHLSYIQRAEAIEWPPG